MMLLELFAYTADNLSYLQDRVANEAFLTTATQRRSVAGHLQLIGYQMDEGAAAHTWLQFQVRSAHTLTTDYKVSNRPKTASEPVIVFEPLAETRLDPQHNAMRLYTAGNEDCCLPSTAVNAALDGNYPNLRAGDYLVIDDGNGQRDVVRLIGLPRVVDAPVITTPPTSPPGNKITIVAWSSTTPLHHNYSASDVILRGNMAVATHGEITIDDTFTAPAPAAQRLRLPLAAAPLAHLDASTLALVAPAVTGPAVATGSGAGQSAPQSISTLTIEVGDAEWQQQSSLLDSAANAQVYRVEIDDQGRATVVFGQGLSGSRRSAIRTAAARRRADNGNIPCRRWSCRQCRRRYPGAAVSTGGGAHRLVHLCHQSAGGHWRTRS